MRLVALGASNLTRALPSLVRLAREAWGDETRVYAALGHGRSYGLSSRFLFRGLPGILDCGLWPALAGEGHHPTRALVTDVGNDVLYGQSPEQILAWVETCVTRLQALTDDVALTGLPSDGIRTLTPARYRFFRTLFVPSCRLPLDEARRRCERVAQGLAELAARRSLRLVRLRPEWYGLDPIHFRRAHWRAAWAEIAGVTELSGALPGGADTPRARDGARYLGRPERMSLFGLELRRRQSGSLQLF